MTRLVEIERHVASVGELREIVGAMRSLAGMHMQEAVGMLPGIRRYAESVEAGIAGVLAMTDFREPRQNGAAAQNALVLCAAEHGFVGAFNERLVDAAAALPRGDFLFVLGSRGAALTAERGRPPDWTHPMATRCRAAPEVVQKLSMELYRRIAARQVTRVEVAYARYRQGHPATIERRLLLPLDPTSLRTNLPPQPPLHNLNPVALYERLIAEYVFALLTEAAVESIASENAARLAAMESAHDNVTKKLETLKQDARQARQTEITAEILDLAVAAKALGAVD